MPSALSTSRTPSVVALDDVTNFLQDALPDFIEGAADAVAGGEFVSAAAEFFANGANINLRAFGSHAHSHLALRQLFKKNRNQNAANGTKMIDEPLVVLRNDSEFGRRFQIESKTCDAALGIETHCAQQLAE